MATSPLARIPVTALSSAPNPSAYAAVMGGLLLLWAGAFALTPPSYRAWVMLLCGVSGAGTLGLFAACHALSLRQRVRARGEPTAGAIRERSSTDGGVVFELPGQGLEPWGSDSWAILILSLALAGVGRALDTAGWPLFAFELALIAALALRLRAASRDFIRIQIEAGRWAIEALEGGRSVHVAGRAPLLPELLPEALLLWSDSGRIGTIRWELSAEERLWLAARLSSLAKEQGSFDERRHEVDQAEPDDDREGNEREQTK